MNVLGAHREGEITRFAVFSAHAEEVLLHLFDHPESGLEGKPFELERGSDDVWRLDLENLRPGQLYGYRVEGPWEPQNGDRFNPSKLLVDPMARAITGEPRLHSSLFSFHHGAKKPEQHDYNSEVSAAYVPKCVVTDDAFDWQGVEPPNVPWEETVIYECHVRGLTRLHPEVDEVLRGTYLGMVAPPVVKHLKHLGVTAVELMPVQHLATEPHLQRRGLRNYWGYSPLGFCAPFSDYATGCLGEQVDEFKTMVRELHRAGLEVILDVVFNHNAEGDHRGPMLSLKGFDNRTYFRLRPNQKYRYVNYTGCGNTLDLGQPAVRQMILETLRYWALVMRVDGFRFDLATTLGRGLRDGGASDAFDPSAALFESIAKDPDLAHVKLIAEPWDVGPEGYRLGQFPQPWAEWNDRYGNAVRAFWRGDQGTLGELATRLAGSRDLFAAKSPLSTVNFVACHDGFTLADVVSYERKHNEDNGEDNRDGADDNLSHNWGREGPTDDRGVLEARARARRNLLATLTLSQGIPMLLYGDEISRTQRGNNNAYCQDNEISWVDWSGSGAEMKDFVRHLLAIRRRFPALRQGRFLEAHEIRWWHPAGRGLTDDDWDHPDLRAMAAFLPADDGRGDLLAFFNGGASPVHFDLPADRDWGACHWTRLLDTRSESNKESPVEALSRLELEPFSLQLFVLTREDDRR